MANRGRKLGINIFTLMQKSGISREEVAEKLNYSYRDMCRILEGKSYLTFLLILHMILSEKVKKGSEAHEVFSADFKSCTAE